MSDNEVDKSPVSTKRARESSIEEDEEFTLKVDPKDQVMIIEQLIQDQVKTVEQLKEDQYTVQEPQYIISKQWFTRWKQYCHRISSPQSTARKLGEQTVPGPIHNQSIVDENGILLPDLILDQDVYAVPEKAWENLVQWYGTNSEPIERDLIEKGDTIQLELYPPTYKLSVVTSNADAPLERCPKFCLSEAATIYELFTTIRETLDLSTQCELQLWLLNQADESPIISPNNLHLATLIDTDNQFVALSLSGSLHIAVGIKGDLRYPSEIKNSDSSSVSSASSIFANGFNNLTTSTAATTPNGSCLKFTRGVCGLQNLGNTCFMNSALQCLSNTPQLSKWFLAENYKKELNRSNPLGMKGQVAEAFGELIEKLWNGNSHSFAPRDFKYTIGKFNSSFYGYQQHDTQELLAFLLDGLHEDLNRIEKKPYIELPDFTDKEDKEIAECSWNYHRARNDSVIVDYFQGQFKSKLVCAECKNVSVTFDPFMYLSLPLPIKKKSKTTIVYVPYDPTQRMQRIVVTLGKDASIPELQKKVAEMMSVQDASTLLIVEIFSHKIYKVLPQYEPVASIGSSDIIYVYQLPGPVPPMPKRQKFSYRLDQEPQVEKIDENQLVVFPVYCSTVDNDNRDSFNGNQPQQFGDPFIVAIPRKDANDYNLLYRHVLQHIERYTHFKLFEEVEENVMEEPPSYEEIGSQSMDVDPQQQPIHTAAAVTAAGGKKTEPMSNLFTMKVFASSSTYGKHIEDLLPCSPSWHPNNLTDLRDRCEAEEKNRIDYKKQKDPDLQMEELDTEMEDTTMDDEIVEDAAEAYFQSQISSKANQEIDELASGSDIDSVSSNKNNADSKRNSSILSTPESVKYKLSPSPETIIRQGEGILLEWSPKKAKQLFGESKFSSSSGVSAAGWDDIEELGDPDENKNATEQKKQVTLSDCLDEFTKEEALSAEDLWYCPKCKKHQMATKKFDLWHMPEIVVVHLKRFSHSRTLRDKIDVMIDFPIQELDLTDRILSVDPNTEDRFIYDLYAVDNHFGGLGGGHYTSYAQNFEDKNWYNFDDSHVTKVDVSEIKTTAAYLLFYKRRRIQEDNTSTVEEILQQVKEKQQAAKMAVYPEPNNTNKLNEINETSKVNGVNEVDGIDESNEVDKVNELDKVDQINKVDGMDEANESKRTEANESKRTETNEKEADTEKMKKVSEEANEFRTSAVVPL